MRKAANERPNIIAAAHPRVAVDPEFVTLCSRGLRLIVRIVRQHHRKTMFENHPNLTLPDLATELWKYVDLSKLLFLLERRALWFSRLDALGDPYEGLPPRQLIDDMWLSANAASESDRQDRIDIVRHNTRTLGMGRGMFAVSCWHASEVESAAMWSLYARIGEGIAIRSTVEKVGRSLIDQTPKVFGGLVRYVDFESYKSESFNLLDWATLKRTSFSHEQEFRAIVTCETGPRITGVPVPVNLNTLITGIRVSPSAESWWVELIRDICVRFGVEAEVGQSSLLSHPGYMDTANRPTGAA